MRDSDPIKHRLKLWLKSEEAMGLPSADVKLSAAPLAARPAPPPSRQSAPERTPRAEARLVDQLQLRSPPQAATPPDVKPRSSAVDNATAPSENLLLTVLDTPFDAPVLSRADKIAALADLDANQVKGCTKCGLSKTRDKTVFGEGDPDAAICFIGEGPGKEEDASGRPFVGRAGQKLDDMIRGMGLAREQVFICNIVKCRAYLTDIGKDRPPTDAETAACTPYLVKQIEIVRPKAIVTLGLPSTRYLLKSRASMTSMRGKWHMWKGIRVMPTWHPAYVLRNYTPQTRAEVWDDLKKVLTELGLPIPNRSGKQE